MGQDRASLVLSQEQVERINIALLSLETELSQLTAILQLKGSAMYGQASGLTASGIKGQ